MNDKTKSGTSSAMIAAVVIGIAIALILAAAIAAVLLRRNRKPAEIFDPGDVIRVDVKVREEWDAVMAQEDQSELVDLIGQHTVFSCANSSLREDGCYVVTADVSCPDLYPLMDRVVTVSNTAEENDGQLAELVNSAQTVTVRSEIYLYAIEGGDGWRIEFSDGFIDAMLGRIYLALRGSGFPPFDTVDRCLAERKDALDKNAPGGSVADTQAASARETLLAAFRADGLPLAPSPVKEIVYRKPDISYPDNFQNRTGIPDATYTLRFADTDGDGEEELIAFALLRDKTWNETRTVEEGKNHAVYYLRVTGYDIAEDGTVRSDRFEPKRFDTLWLYELEGSYTCYAAVGDTGTVELLVRTQYEEAECDYLIFRFQDGRFVREAHEVFKVDQIASVSEGRSYRCTIYDGDSVLSELKGRVGEDDLVRTVARTRGALEGRLLSTVLFPVDRDGDALTEETLSDRCDLEFGPKYDFEICQNIEFELMANILYFNDRTGSYGKY